MLWMRIASALEGLRVPPEIVIWMDDNFDKNFRIENDCAKYLKQNCCDNVPIDLSVSNIFFLDFSNLQDFSILTGCFWPLCALMG